MKIPKVESGKEWRFRLTEDYSVDLGMGWSGYHGFYDENLPLAKLRDDTLTIKAGYAFDGCSPAFRIFGRWVGTPTPPSAIGPALIHDVLSQFGMLPCVPWTQRQADEIFFNQMRDHGFCMKGTYHGAVALLGSFYRRFAPLSDSVSCHSHETKP